MIDNGAAELGDRSIRVENCPGKKLLFCLRSCCPPARVLPRVTALQGSFPAARRRHLSSSKRDCRSRAASWKGFSKPRLSRCSNYTLPVNGESAAQSRWIVWGLPAGYTDSSEVPLWEAAALAPVG